MRLENWSITGTLPNPYAAPETIHMQAIGKVYDNPKFKDGSHVRTSDLKSLDIENMVAVTRNSTYELGEPDPKYIEYLEKGTLSLKDQSFGLTA